MGGTDGTPAAALATPVPVRRLLHGAGQGLLPRRRARRQDRRGASGNISRRRGTRRPRRFRHRRQRHHPRPPEGAAGRRAGGDHADLAADVAGARRFGNFFAARPGRTQRHAIDVSRRRTDDRAPQGRRRARPDQAASADAGRPRRPDRAPHRRARRLRLERTLHAAPARRQLPDHQPARLRRELLQRRAADARRSRATPAGDGARIHGRQPARLAGGARRSGSGDRADPRALRAAVVGRAPALRGGNAAQADHAGAVADRRDEPRPLGVHRQQLYQARHGAGAAQTRRFPAARGRRRCVVRLRGAARATGGRSAGRPTPNSNSWR